MLHCSKYFINIYIFILINNPVKLVMGIHRQVKKMTQDHRAGEWKTNHFDSKASVLYHYETKLLVTDCTWEEEEYGQRKQDTKCNPWISGLCKWMDNGAIYWTLVYLQKAGFVENEVRLE